MNEPAEIRHLPVLAEAPVARPVEGSGGELVPRYPRLAALPAPVVAAAGGFLAGVAAFVLVRVLRRPPSTAGVRLGRRGRKAQEVVASRSFLVDVHLLRR